MGIVLGEREVLELEVEEVLHRRVEVHLGCRSRRASQLQARLLDMLRTLVCQLGLSVVLVTHDLAVARLLAHRLMVMRRGQVVEAGLTDQILDDPQHEYTQLLVSSVLTP